MNEERVLLDYANDDQALLCLLYDLDLMPEQTMGGEKYEHTLAIIDHWRAYRLQTDQEREEDRAAIREMAWALKCLAEWEDEPNHGMAGFARGSLMKNAPHIQRATQAPGEGTK